MKIGLLPVDSNYPNLALMKLSAWHKQRGDNVEFYTAWSMYDIVYMSKIFTFTPDYPHPVSNTKQLFKGGTGYKMYNQNLNDEVEHICAEN